MRISSKNITCPYSNHFAIDDDNSELKVPITSTLFSTLLILRNRPKYIVFFSGFTFLLALKDGKSGQTLIHNRAMKGNGFDTGLTSQIALH